MGKHLTEPFHTKKNSSLVSASMSTSASMVHFLSVMRAHVNHVLYDPETKLIYCNRFSVLVELISYSCNGSYYPSPLQKKLWWLIWNQPSSQDILTLKQQTKDTKKPHHTREIFATYIPHCLSNSKNFWCDFSFLVDLALLIPIAFLWPLFKVFCPHNVYWQDCSPKHRLLQNSHRTRIINAHIRLKSLLYARLGKPPCEGQELENHVVNIISYSSKWVGYAN